MLHWAWHWECCGYMKLTTTRVGHSLTHSVWFIISWTSPSPPYTPLSPSITTPALPRPPPPSLTSHTTPIAPHRSPALPRKRGTSNAPPTQSPRIQRSCSWRLVSISPTNTELIWPWLAHALATPRTAGGVGKSALTLRFMKGYFVETVSVPSFDVLPSAVRQARHRLPVRPDADSAARLVLHPH